MMARLSKVSFCKCTWYADAISLLTILAMTCDQICWIADQLGECRLNRLQSVVAPAAAALDQVEYNSAISDVLGSLI